MRVPMSAKMVALVVCSAVALSNLALAVAALAQGRPNWVMFAFELVVLLACVLGIQIARGRYSDGPALGLLCVAGTVLVGSAFGYIAGGRVLFSTDLRMLVVARALAGAAIAGAAAWTVLSRDPRATLPLFIRGCLVGVPVPALLGAAWAFRVRLGALPDMAQIGVALGAFVLFTGLLAASTQLLVNAFTIGIRRADETASA